MTDRKQSGTLKILLEFGPIIVFFLGYKYAPLPEFFEGDESLEKGLYFYTFIDIDETNLYVINTWDNENSSKKVHSMYEDFLKQVKEMGVKMVILGGNSETSYSNAAILDNFTKID